MLAKVDGVEQLPLTPLQVDSRRDTSWAETEDHQEAAPGNGTDTVNRNSEEMQLRPLQKRRGDSGNGTSSEV